MSKDRRILSDIQREINIERAKSLEREILGGLYYTRIGNMGKMMGDTDFSVTTSVELNSNNKQIKDSNMEAFTVSFDSREQGILYQEIAEEYGFEDFIISKTCRLKDYDYLHFSEYNGIKGTGHRSENHLDNPSYSDFVKALIGEYQWEETYYLTSSKEYEVEINDGQVTIGCRNYKINWLIRKIKRVLNISKFEYIEVDGVGILKEELENLLDYLQDHV